MLRTNCIEIFFSTILCFIHFSLFHLFSCLFFNEGFPLKEAFISLMGRILRAFLPSFEHFAPT